MAKTNFTKAEESINDTMKKVQVEQLLHEADKVSAEAKNQVALHDRDVESQTRALNNIRRELHLLYKKDDQLYQSLGYKKKEIAHLLKDASQLSPEDWEKVKQIKERIKKYKEELSKILPHKTDEELIEEARHKHINKRYNIQERWLPLDTKSKV